MREVHGWRRVRRWVAAIALGLAAFVGFAILGIVLAMQTHWGQELARREIEAQLADVFSGGATIGHIEGTPFTEIVARDLVINGPDGRPAITIGRVRVHVRLLPLVTRTVVVDRFVADDVDARLDRDARGEPRIEHLVKPSPPSAWSLRLPVIAVHRAHVLFQSDREVIDLDDIELAGAASIPADGPISTAARLRGRWRQRDAPVEAAAVVVSDPDSTWIPSMFARVSDVEVSAAAVRITNAGAISGAAIASVPAATLAALVPELQVPVDIELALEATPEGGLTRVGAAGTAGGAPFGAFVRGDLDARTASGFVRATGLDLYALTNGAFDGVGTANVLFDVAAVPGQELPRARAVVQAWTERGTLPGAFAFATVTSAGDRATAVAGVTGVDGVHGSLELAVRKRGDTLALERAVVIAATRQHGMLDARLAARGELAPRVDLAVAGHVNGRALRLRDLSVSSLALQVDAVHVPARPAGRGRVEVVDLARGGQQLGSLAVTAESRAGGAFQVSLHAAPRQAPWMVDTDALVTLGDTVVVELQHHEVRTADCALWHGNGGRLAIGPRKIVLRDLTSASPGGKLTLAGEYVRAGRGVGDLHAKVDGALPLSTIEPGLVGRVDAAVEVDRRARQWTGTASATVAGFSLFELALDGNAKLEVRGGRVTAVAEARSQQVGHAKLALGVDAPRDLTDVRAWRSLARHALHDFDVQLDRIDVRAVAKLAHAEADLGSLEGQLSGELRLADARDELDASANVEVRRLGSATLEAHVALPERVLDPAVWKRLGVRALRSAQLKTSELAFGPESLQQFGIVSPLRGSVAMSAELGAGAESGHVTVELRELHGGALAKPIGAKLDATIDRNTAHATLAVRSHQLELLTATADVPVGVDRLRAEPRAVPGAPLHATITLPDVPVPQLLSLFAKTQVASGALTGTIEVAGTVERPTAVAKLEVRELGVPRADGTRALAFVNRLGIDGHWDGATGDVSVVADEAGGRTLRVTARARRDALQNATVEIDATRFELAVLAAFLPGPAGGVAGRLDAKLSLHGLDPKRAQLAGSLHVVEGRIPIAPLVGTLFHTDLAVDVKANTVNVVATGKLGRGTVKLVGSVPLVVGSSSQGQFQLSVRKVQLIGPIEPIIDGDLTAQLSRPDMWHAKIKIANAVVRVPKRSGDALAPVGAPSDLVYTTGARRVRPARVRASPQRHASPERPVLVADIELGKTKIESAPMHGNASGKLYATLGDELHVIGDISLDHGDLDLFSRRYRVDRAALHFDGSTDPMLDVRVTYDFLEATTIVEVRGRASDPDLQLSSNPAIYSQAELLGFLLGGEPNGDPNNAPSATQRVAAAGESLVANAVGDYVKRVLPVNIDVLRYETATSSSSAAVTVGKWITHELFLAWTQRLEPRPDENTGQAEIEYWLQRRLAITGTIGDRGYNGADLLWRRRW